MKYQPVERPQNRLKRFSNLSAVETWLKCSRWRSWWWGTATGWWSPGIAGNTKPVKRVLINDNTLPAVKRHWQILKTIVISKDFTLRPGAFSCRCRLWLLYDTCVHHPAKARGYQGVLSVGRVQTPVLASLWIVPVLTRTINPVFTNHDRSLSARCWCSQCKLETREFAPLTDRKLLDKAWANGTAHLLRENQPPLKRQQLMIKKRRTVAI